MWRRWKSVRAKGGGLSADRNALTHWKISIKVHKDPDRPRVHVEVCRAGMSRVRVDAQHILSKEMI